MAQSRFRMILACITSLCVAATTAISTGLGRFTEFILGSLRPDPFIYRDHDELFQPAFAFASPDPHVDRHEAQTGTRAAARGR